MRVEVTYQVFTTCRKPAQVSVRGVNFADLKSSMHFWQGDTDAVFGTDSNIIPKMLVASIRTGCGLG